MPLRKYYGDYDEKYFADVDQHGTIIFTSGSSGDPKTVWQPPRKSRFNSKIACIVQGITEHSVVYTCLTPTRAGGLFAQTIPALTIGATVDLDQFSPYEYVRVVNKYTHSHLTPKQAKAVMMTKGFRDLDLTGHTFLCGSEPVTWDIIEAFVERGARFICIWGMTEVGVNAIMHIFEDMDDVKGWQVRSPSNATILGNIVNCNWYIDQDECLFVDGEISVYDGWFNTKDLVVFENNSLWYKGRQDTDVDFNKPKKG